MLLSSLCRHNIIPHSLLLQQLSRPTVGLLGLSRHRWVDRLPVQPFVGWDSWITVNFHFARYIVSISGDDELFGTVPYCVLNKRRGQGLKHASSLQYCRQLSCALTGPLIFNKRRGLCIFVRLLRCLLFELYLVRVFSCYAASFKRLLSVDVSVCLSVCPSATLMLNVLETKLFKVRIQ